MKKIQQSGLATLLIALLLISGCAEKEADAPRSLESEVNKRELKTPADKISVTGATWGKPGMEEARPSDFHLPLYPGGSSLRSGRTKGLSPQDEEMDQAVLEMYTIDPIDDVVQYYRKKCPGVTIRDFNRERGKNVIISDLYGIVPLPGPDCKKGTTLLLTRDKEAGRTRMVYTGFSLDDSR